MTSEIIVAHKKDILDKTDVKLMAITFFENLLNDEEFKKIFLDVAQVDIMHHIDTFIEFWTSVLFQSNQYKGDLIEIHLDLNRRYAYGLNARHFNHWLKVFGDTIDSMYAGDNADKAKTSAWSLASVIKMKIDNLEQMRLETNN